MLNNQVRIAISIDPENVFFDYVRQQVHAMVVTVMDNRNFPRMGRDMVYQYFSTPSQYAGTAVGSEWRRVYDLPNTGNTPMPMGSDKITTATRQMTSLNRSTAMRCSKSFTTPQKQTKQEHQLQIPSLDLSIDDDDDTPATHTNNAAGHYKCNSNIFIKFNCCRYQFDCLLFYYRISSRKEG